MILFKTGIQAEGCLAELAAILSLLPVTGRSVATDMTVWATIVRDRLRESSLFESKWKLRIVCSVANLSCFVISQQPHGNILTEFQLGKFLIRGGIVQNVCIDNACVHQVKEYTLPPLDGTVCKAVVQHELIS